jgi:hypothetical protein
MSANYNCIITKQQINVPVEIPPFRKGEVLTIPLNLENCGIYSFLNNFQNGRLIENDNDSQLIFDILEKLNLTDSPFMLLHDEEFADYPDSELVVYDKGSIVEGTHFTTGTGEVGNYKTAWSYIGVSDRDYYAVDWYNIAEEDYRLKRNSDHYLC